MSKKEKQNLICYNYQGWHIVAYEDNKKDKKFLLFLFVVYFTIPFSLILLCIPKLGKRIIKKAFKWIES